MKFIRVRKFSEFQSLSRSEVFHLQNFHSHETFPPTKLKLSINIFSSHLQTFSLAKFSQQLIIQSEKLLRSQNFN